MVTTRRRPTTVPPAPRPERRRASTADLVERIDARERLQLAHAERDAAVATLKAVVKITKLTGFMSAVDQQVVRDAEALLAVVPAVDQQAYRDALTLIAATKECSR